MRSKKSKPRAPNGKAKTERPAIDQAALAQVFLWIVQGQTESSIVEAAAAQPELVKGQDVRQLIDAARAEIAKAADLDPQLVKAWCFEAYRELHRRCVEMGDYPAAIRAVGKIDELTKRMARETDLSPEPGNETGSSLCELDQARAHLAPLFHDGETMSLVELARLAAARILDP